MDANVQNAFVIVASLAIFFQAVMLIALFFSLRKTTQKMERLADQVETKAIPLLDSAKTLIDETGPRIKEISENMQEITTTVRGQVKRVDAVLDEVVDRTRLQIIRVDDMVSRTMDKVEETGEAMSRSVSMPIRHLSGLVQGLTTGFATFLQQRRRRAMDAAIGASANGDDEELFI